MGLITILSEKTQPLADYGFNWGVISFGGVIIDRWQVTALLGA